MATLNRHFIGSAVRYILILFLAFFFTGVPEVVEGLTAKVEVSDHGFRFIRIRFNPTTGSSSGGGRGRRGGWGGDPKWNHDYPTAEMNLYDALERTTKVSIDGPPLILTLSDKRIYEYPILYLCEPGFWLMDETEEENLRKYFDRGGFVLFDDFRDNYGTREWSNFYMNIKRLYPDRDLVEIDERHPVWSIYYDVDPVEVPSLVSGMSGSKYVDRYYTMYDDSGRMLFLACYNQDIGDGWEWPNRNIDQAATESFKMGINFIIYSLTH